MLLYDLQVVEKAISDAKIKFLAEWKQTEHIPFHSTNSKPKDIMPCLKVISNSSIEITH